MAWHQVLVMDAELTANLIYNDHRVVVSLQVLNAEFMSDLHANKQSIVFCHIVGTRL